MKRLKLGIIGGGPGSWIGHVHRIASRFDDKYEIVAGVFSRNYKINQSFGASIGIKKNRCYKNYKDLCYSEKKIKKWYRCGGDYDTPWESSRNSGIIY